MDSLLETVLLVAWFVVSVAFISWIVNAWLHTRNGGRPGGRVSRR
jgi:hypothetical protein